MRIKNKFKFFYKYPEGDIERDILYTAEKQDENNFKVTWNSPSSEKTESTSYHISWVANALEEKVWIIQK